MIQTAAALASAPPSMAGVSASCQCTWLMHTCMRLCVKEKCSLTMEVQVEEVEVEGHPVSAPGSCTPACILC
eukprot:1138991-Pelagomonas_calceolata.AAC.5